MNKTFEGKTVEEAVKAASKELGLASDAFTYTVTDVGSKGFLGIGAKNAVIEVTVRNDPEGFLSGYLKELFGMLGVTDYSEKIEIGEDKVINIQLDGEGLDAYTEKNTDIMDSLQFLLAITVNKKFDEHYKVTFNVNDYKEKSVSRIEALAVKNAKQVQRTHRKIILFPMSAYQRRIVHSKLQNFENITTYSIGTEPDRKVVIAYQYPEGEKKNSQPRNNGGKNRKPAPAAEENGNAAESAETENTENRSERKSGNGRYNNNRQGGQNRGGRRDGGSGRGGRRSSYDSAAAPAAPAQPKIKQLYPRPTEDDDSFGK